MWFDHWVLNGTSQTQGTRALSVTLSATDSQAQAVYVGLVGDLNSDGHVNALMPI